MAVQMIVEELLSAATLSLKTERFSAEKSPQPMKSPVSNSGPITELIEEFLRRQNSELITSGSVSMIILGIYNASSFLSLIICKMPT